MEEYSFIVGDIRPVSLNEIYKGIHWSKRKEYKEEWRAAFMGIHNGAKFDKPVWVYYAFGMKNPMDSSNLAFMEKLIEDSLVKDGVMADDTPKFVRCTIGLPLRASENSVLVHLRTKGNLTPEAFEKFAKENLPGVSKGSKEE